MNLGRFGAEAGSATVRSRSSRMLCLLDEALDVLAEFLQHSLHLLLGDLVLTCSRNLATYHLLLNEFQGSYTNVTADVGVHELDPLDSVHRKPLRVDRLDLASD